MLFDAVDENCAGIGAMDAGEDFSAGGFARPVFAHESVAFAAGDGEGNAVERRDASESFGDGAEFNHLNRAKTRRLKSAGRAGGIIS